MNTAQHAFVREQFKKWVESTDVAEQCGLTRKEMIDSVEFNEPLEFNHLHVVHRGYYVSDDEIREGRIRVAEREAERRRQLLIDKEAVITEDQTQLTEKMVSDADSRDGPLFDRPVQPSQFDCLGRGLGTRDDGSQDALREEFEDNVMRLGKLISRGCRCRDGHVFLNLVCVYCGAKQG